MEMIKDRTIGEIVTENIKTADVFKKHGIDFCCGGGIALSKACEKYGVPEETLLRELNEASIQSGRALNYQNWTAGFLVEHIQNIHHSHVQEAIPLILQYGTKTARVHGEVYPELPQIMNVFRNLADELFSHMAKEEKVLFPAIKKIFQDPEKQNLSVLSMPMAVLEKEHENAGDLMKEIRTLSNDYTPPMGACNTFRAFYAKLNEFEDDLYLHVHLENNVLFQKLRALQEA